MEAKMKAMFALAYGSPEVYELRELEIPSIGEDEILVKVKTASATTADTMMRTGKPYLARLVLGINRPKKAIPGTGFAGIVEKTGTNIKDFKVGDRVFGETGFNFSSNAEYIKIKEDAIVLPMPESMDFFEAASFGDGHLTSYNFLKVLANIQEGDQVLINGASGALGTSAIQIAKALGAEVTAVCSGRNIGFVRSLGADHIIDYQKEDFTQSEFRYDFVYDTIGKSSFTKAKKVLKQHGTYLSPVLKFGLLLQILFSKITGGKKALFEATGANPENKLRNLLTELTELFKEGKLKTPIDRQFPLEKLAEAHHYIDSGRKRGNVVIYNT